MICYVHLYERCKKMGTNNLDLLMTNEEYQRFSWGYHSITGYMRYDGDELKIMMERIVDKDTDSIYIFPSTTELLEMDLI